jgi:hypothetical protein
MPDFNVRSDSVNVEQIMEQIRARIREKRGVDYTEEQIRQLATVKLEKFLDPRGVRSDLLDQFRQAQPPYQPPELPNFAFEEDTLFASTRGPLRFIRRLLLPILKLFFNPNPLIQALHIQSRLNTMYADREAHRESAAHSIGQLQYEVLHNLVVEMTRMGIEVKNLKMRVESLASRLEFNERRARALESVVVYKPADERGGRERTEPRAAPREAHEVREAYESRIEPTAGEPVAQGSAPTAATAPEGPGQRSRRRRRRRGRRGGGSAAAVMAPGAGGEVETAPSSDGIESAASPDPSRAEPAPPAAFDETPAGERPSVHDEQRHSSGPGDAAPDDQQ